MKMTKEEHKQRHIELHRKLDELLADFLSHNKGKHLSNTNLMEFMEWSYKQTIDPEE